METAINTLQVQTSSTRLPKDLQQVCNRLAVPAPLQAIITRAQSYAAVSDIVAAKDEMKIAKVAQQQGSAPTRSSIIAMLIYMNMQLHLASSLTDDNIRAIADDLTNNPEIKWWLTLADVQLLCRNILNGNYAHYYNRFGLDTFYECFTKYCNERNDIHHNQAESHPVADPAVLSEVNLGYRQGEDGRLIVENTETKQRRPMRYRYDENGKIVGENQEFWEKSLNKRFREHQKHNPDSTPEELEKINRSNRVMVRMREIMKENPGIDYATAILRADKEIV